MENLVRAAVKSLRDRRPAYGHPQPDGTFVEEDGTVHAAGTWFRSKQAGSSDDDSDEQDSEDVS